jgi:hypothetical protein
MQKRRTFLRLAFMAAVLSIFLGAALSHRANYVTGSHPSAFLNDEEKVTPTVSANTETWHIHWRTDQPNVKQHISVVMIVFGAIVSAVLSMAIGTTQERRRMAK